MSRMARNKGKRGERMLATELREAFPEFADEIRRGWQTREGDDDPDVIVPFDVWFEHKFLARFNIKPLLQAVQDSKGRGVPIAVVRANRQEPVGIMRWVDLLEMLKVWVRRKGAEDERRKEPDERGDHQPARRRRWVVQSRDHRDVRSKRGREDVPRDPSAERRGGIRRG